jgi:hypothetical protein
MEELGWFRYLGEVKETAALAVFFGTMALPSACIGVAGVTSIGQDWAGDALTYPPIVLLLANLTQVSTTSWSPSGVSGLDLTFDTCIIQVVFSITNIAVGLGWLLTNKGNPVLSLANAVVTFLAWFPFITVISLIIFVDTKFPMAGQPFVPM